MRIAMLYGLCCKKVHTYIYIACNSDRTSENGSKLKRYNNENIVL